ncbi:TKL protein kinase, variant 1 [Aphanomyces invadans]|uniref:TKL protein kinase, variant 1 n=2 Tax=Aphanomyces invadans TaxID=157072 RepID=A0A024THZ8_9STRA|nr:TKL protein kinase, variant 1 [Aphanomyces invadans]ETV92937.1 TKL protein kinase, variant 1 [Aphanomyces invadans]|eukprot:XP_008878462.1 TKL protein kinase, variant 1 [Aphanomyces invadans]
MQRAAWWMEARDDARGRRLRHLGSYAADDSDEMSTTTIALIASVSTLMVVLLLYLACRMNARLHKRHHDLRREVRRIQATRAVMERSKQSSYHSTHDGETGVSVGLGHVQLAHDVRFDPNFAHTRIPHHELHNLRFVAKGSGTVVFQAVFNNVVIAVKQLLPSQCGSLLIVSDFMREIRLAATLEHPNIVGFVGLAWTEGSSLADLSLLTEFMPNGDLMGFLKYEKKTPAADRRLRPTWDAPNPLATPASSIRTTFSNGGHSSSRHRMRREMIEQGTSKASLAAEVADALAYLHSFQPTVIHRDLKSKNILLSRTWNARLNDFGYSRVTSQDDLMTMNVGTIAWIAPEVLTGGRYTEQADIYSFGVLLSELDSLQPPYTDLTRDYIEEHHSELSNDLHHPKVKAKAKNLSNAFIAMSVAEGKLAPTFTNFIPHELLVLARECLSHAPQNRPTAIELSFRLRSFIVGD